MRLFRQVTMNDELLEKFSFNRELSMQAYVLERPEILKLDDMDDIEIYEEEVTIKGGGRKGKNNGRIDMVAAYSGEYIAIIEFKKGRLVLDNLDQLENYLKQTEELEKLAPCVIPKEQTENPKWIGILVGSSIAPDLEKKISEGHLCGDIPVVAIAIERFRSATGNVYVTTDTYLFKNNLHGRDYTKYEFNGDIHYKNRLVLAIIKKYVAEHPKTTYEELRRIFPRSLANNGIFETLQKANETYATTNHKRHFINIKKGEVINLQDEQIAVSSQWSITNIKDFMKLAKEKLNYEIKEIKHAPQKKNTRSTTGTSKSGQDKTKYEFKGKPYGKGPLVLAVIQEHVARNPEITHEELRNTFPEKLANNRIFDTLEKANEIHQRDRKRHFIKPKEVIGLTDAKIAVSSQWSINNIGGFISKARELGYEITEIKT